MVVRVRPMSSQEIKDGRQLAVHPDEERGEIAIRNPAADAREAPKVFTFDHVYGPDCTQKSIYDITASPIVDSVIEVSLRLSVPWPIVAY